jgi:hypothetical protein
MNNLDYEFSPRLQKLVDIGESGTDILHGELKNLMLEAERQLTLAQKQEEETEEVMDSIERVYWEGQLDALTTVYQLTYDLSFAINDRIKSNE